MTSSYRSATVQGQSEDAHHEKEFPPLSLPNRIAAYDDCFEIFAKALANRGLRVAFKTRSEASFFMMRLQQARSLERAENKRLYSEDDPRWGYSEYDKLMVRAPREGEAPPGEEIWWIYLDIPGADIIAIEPLDQVPLTENLS